MSFVVPVPIVDVEVAGAAAGAEDDVPFRELSGLAGCTDDYDGADHVTATMRMATPIITTKIQGGTRPVLLALLGACASFAWISS